MRAAWVGLGLLAGVLFLQAAGCGARLSPDRAAPADAFALLAETTDAYELNGQRVEAGRFDDAVLARLLKSSDPHVRKAAQTAAALKFLRTRGLQQAAGGELAKQAAAGYPRLIADRVVAALAAPDAEQDIRGAARALEDFAGPDTQRAMNRGRASALLEHGLRISLRSDFREWEAASNPGRADPGDALRVLLDTRRPGLVMVKNQGKQALHHCLIFTRLRADVQRVRTEAGREDSVGAALLPAVGFSKEFVEESRLAARLRYLYDEQDKGRMIYLPELRAGESVSTWFDGVVSFVMSSGADISLWCDEAAVEHKAPANWDKVKLAAETRWRGGVVPQAYPKLTAPSVPVPRPRRMPGELRRSASDPGAWESRPGFGGGRMGAGTRGERFGGWPPRRRSPGTPSPGGAGFRPGAGPAGLRAFPPGGARAEMRPGAGGGLPQRDGSGGRRWFGETRDNR